MGKRMTKAESQLVGVLFIIGLIVVGFMKLFESIGYVIPIVVVVVIIAGYIYYKKKKHRERVEYLTKKYTDPQIVDKILEGTVWQGQTAVQLKDTLGEPAGIDQKVLKTKKKEIWKYGHQGGNRYNLRITLDDDVVIGWDDRS